MMDGRRRQELRRKTRARIQLLFANTCEAKLVKTGETLRASNSFCAHDEHATYNDEMTGNGELLKKRLLTSGERGLSGRESNCRLQGLTWLN